jgi:ABC-type multidrug transport system ATPase subunit
MEIKGENLGKRFNKDWVLRNLDLNIQAGQRLAIVGPNGSGKSTLLKIIGSYSLPNEGSLMYHQGGAALSPELIQLDMNFAAPYFNLIEEFTLSELFDFHERFKTPLSLLPEILEKSGLATSTNKLIKAFSSGMKQRVKLMLAFGYEAKMVLLDEPTTNLDSGGIEWFQDLITTANPDQIIVVASNLEHEIGMCSDHIPLIKSEQKNTKL